jgi:hypothetical protein
MRTRIFLLTLAAASLFVSGCASNKIHGDKDVIASGGSRPDWVDNTKYQNQTALVKAFNDNTDQPKYYYVVSQGLVDNEELLPSCYDFARTAAGSELARSIDEQVKRSTATSTDGSSTTGYSEVLSHSNAAVVGAETKARHWEMTRDKDGNEKVVCYTVTAIPYKSYNKLKTFAENTAASRSSGAVRRSKKQVQKTQDQSTVTDADSEDSQ